jgi:hypothetical protein
MHPVNLGIPQKRRPHRSSGKLRAGSRNIGLLLAAVPMVARLDEVATELQKSILEDGGDADSQAVRGSRLARRTRRSRRSGIRRSARVNRLEEGVEQMDCVAARRGGTFIRQSARIQLFL